MAKAAAQQVGPAPERVVLRHGFVALLYDEVQPGHETAPEPPPLVPPKLPPSVSRGKGR